VSEADTCTKYVVPKLRDAGWDDEPHWFAEQRTFTDGRYVSIGSSSRRLAKKRADYLLYSTPDFLLAVVEAKAEHKHPADGLEQAKEYAIILGLKFAYSTNGHGIVEFDFLSGRETVIPTFPRPEQLWRRITQHEKLGEAAADTILSPAELTGGKPPRYYQQIAINRAIQGLVQKKKRILLTLATGTGKTVIAFQICWKLWSAKWNREGDGRRPRILFLADRNILVDDPMEKTFAPFGDARFKIEGGKVSLGREMYFAIYQALAGDESGPGLVEKFPPDFFDLIIVDECHRGSVREESSWRAILKYFESAHQLGMTATPLREDNRDTYEYFGNPLYQYSLKQGIEDGFLAPYRVHRITTSVDADGWKPAPGTLDRHGREIPEKDYRTKDFERTISLPARTLAIARHLTEFLRTTNRFAKTIVFCVNQEHALDMRRELGELNKDLVQQYPDYVCRVTSEEKEVGMGNLDRFKDVETKTPVIVTTSQLLTTGVDIPTCQNVVLVRVINSMTEFKQIIGRGTRLRDDYGKFFFNILDYTGSATRLFADEDFDGEPALITEVEIDAQGKEKPIEYPTNPISGGLDVGEPLTPRSFALASLKNRAEPSTEPRKYYFDGGQVEIRDHLVYDLNGEGEIVDSISLSEYAGREIRTRIKSVAELRARWFNRVQRLETITWLRERGIEIDDLADAAGCSEADPLDLLAHAAFGAALRTHEERAATMRARHADFFEGYAPEAREILLILVENFAAHGLDELTLPDAFKVARLADLGSVGEIVARFGGASQLREAVDQLQSLLYAE
jgi:type I restriction enzyme R subunit